MANEISGDAPVRVAQVGPDGVLLQEPRSAIGITATGAAGAAVTLTIPAAGGGLFNHLTHLSIVLYATAALAGGATPNVVTSTGLLGTPAWTFPSGLAIGTTEEQKFESILAIRGSAANTALTIAAPAVAGGIWRITAGYYTAP